MRDCFEIFIALNGLVVAALPPTLFGYEKYSGRTYVCLLVAVCRTLFVIDH